MYFLKKHDVDIANVIKLSVFQMLAKEAGIMYLM